MSDTRSVTLNPTSFVAVVTGGTQGFMTNRTGDLVYYCVSETQPADSFDTTHILAHGDSIPFTFAVTQNIWAKSTGDGGRLIVTEG